MASFRKATIGSLLVLLAGLASARGQGAVEALPKMEGPAKKAVSPVQEWGAKAKAAREAAEKEKAEAEAALTEAKGALQKAQAAVETAPPGPLKAAAEEGLKAAQERLRLEQERSFIIEAEAVLAERRFKAEKELRDTEVLEDALQGVMKNDDVTFTAEMGQLSAKEAQVAAEIVKEKEALATVLDERLASTREQVSSIRTTQQALAEELKTARKVLKEAAERGEPETAIRPLQAQHAAKALAAEVVQGWIDLGQRAIKALDIEGDVIRTELAAAKSGAALKAKRSEFISQHVIVTAAQVEEKKAEAQQVEREVAAKKKAIGRQREAAERKAKEAEEEAKQAEEAAKRDALTEPQREVAEAEKRQYDKKVEVNKKHAELFLAKDEALEISRLLSEKRWRVPDLRLRRARMSSGELQKIVAAVKADREAEQKRLSRLKARIDAEVQARKRTRGEGEFLRKQWESAQKEQRRDLARILGEHLREHELLLEHQKRYQTQLSDNLAEAEELHRVYDELLAAAGSEMEVAFRQLLVREPSAISWDDVREAWADLRALVRSLPGALAALPRRIGSYVTAEAQRNFLFAAGAGIILFVASLLLAVRVRRRLKQAVAKFEGAAMAGNDRFVRAIESIIFREARPAIFFVAAFVFTRLFDLPAGVERVVLLYIGAYALYRLAASCLYETLNPDETVFRLIRCRDAIAAHGFCGFRRIAFYSAVFVPLILTFQTFGYRPGFVAALRLVYQAGAVFLLLLVAYRRDMVLGLLPRAGTGLSAAINRAVNIMYPFIVALVVSVFAASSIGYVNLARYLGRATAATAVLVCGALVVWKVANNFFASYFSPYDASFRRARMDQHQALTALRVCSTVTAYALATLAVVLALAAWGIDLGTVYAEARDILGAERDLKFMTISLERVLEVVLALVGALLLARYLRTLLDRSVFPHTSIDLGTRNAINKACQYTIMTIAVIVGLNILDVQTDTLKWFAGFLGIGVGFGLQSIVGNFISGLIILTERHIKLGDYVEVKGTYGTVVRIGARSTTIATNDNINVIVPNSDFISADVINWSHKDPNTRLHIEIGVSYGSNPEQVREVLLEVAGKHKLVLTDPSPQVWFVGFGDSALNFEMLVWTDQPVRRFDITSDLYYSSFTALKEADIVIPFPQRDLHLKSVDPALMKGGKGLLGGERDGEQ